MLKIDLQLPIDPSQRGPTIRRGRTSLGELLQDPAVLGVLLIAVCVVFFGFWLNTRTNTHLEQLSQNVRQAVRDSTRLKEDIKRADELRRKRAEIQASINTIRGIDQNRFAFPHLMDQVAASVLSEIYIDDLTTTVQDSTTGVLTVRLSGYAPSNDAVGAFIQQLEASPFIANVVFASASKLSINKQDVVQFRLTAQSESPDPSFLETVTIQPDGSLTSGSSMPSGAHSLLDGAPATSSVPAGLPPGTAAPTGFAPPPPAAYQPLGTSVPAPSTSTGRPPAMPR